MCVETEWREGKMKRKWERKRRGPKREETPREAYRRLSQKINAAQFGATAKSGSRRRSRALGLTVPRCAERSSSVDSGEALLLLSDGLVWRFEVEVEVKLFDGSEATHVTVHARLARFSCGCLS